MGEGLLYSKSSGGGVSTMGEGLLYDTGTFLKLDRKIVETPT